jgi:hypothetical protein
MSGLKGYSWGYSFQPALTQQGRSERKEDRDKDGIIDFWTVDLLPGTATAIRYEQSKSEKIGSVNFERISIGEGKYKITYERILSPSRIEGSARVKLGIGDSDSDMGWVQYADYDGDSRLDVMSDMLRLERTKTYILFEDQWQNVEVAEEGDYFAHPTSKDGLTSFAFIDGNWAVEDSR